MSGAGPWPGSSRALVVVRHVLRSQPRNYAQIWAIAAAAHLVCAILFPAVVGWPRPGAAAFVSAAPIWSGVGTAQSYRLNRRRTG